MATYGAAAVLRRQGTVPVGRGLRFSFAALCGAVLLQLMPLPAALLGAVSPATLLIAARTEQAAVTPAESFDPDHYGLMPISLDANATALGLAFLLTLGLFFVGVARTMGLRGARRLAAGLAGLGTIVAVLGIAESRQLWDGFYATAGLPLPPDSRPLGPFSSKNHYAGWMLMALAVTMGYLCALLEHAGIAGSPGSRERAGGRRAGRAPMIVFLCAATAMVLALVETRSRAGILCLVVAVVALGGLVMCRRVSTRARMVVATPLVLLPLMGIMVTGVQPLIGRFSVDSWSTAHGRLPIWRQVIAIARDFPIAGAGFNAYQSVVPFYPSPDLDEPYEGAHNDFLQLAAEGGLLVGIPALAAAGFFVRETRRRFRESSDDGVTRWLRVGAVVGMSLIAMQETVEFSLQIPANAVLFVVLAAIAVHRPAPHPYPWADRADRASVKGKMASYAS
jgi:O-antigen ligase